MTGGWVGHRGGVMQRNDPPLQNDPWAILLRREMIHGSFLYVQK